MNVLERITAAGAPESMGERPTADSTLSVNIEPNQARGLLELLAAQCGFETVTFITAIDRGSAPGRFEVAWQLRSLQHGDRVRVTTRVDDAVPTVTDLWPGAAYMERECYDMFGIDFEGHEGLERLLMPAGYGHHPLRKDVPHRGIEPDRLYREWERDRR